MMLLMLQGFDNFCEWWNPESDINLLYPFLLSYLRFPLGGSQIILCDTHTHTLLVIDYFLAPYAKPLDESMDQKVSILEFYNSYQTFLQKCSTTLSVGGSGRRALVYSCV